MALSAPGRLTRTAGSLRRLALLARRQGGSPSSHAGVTLPMSQASGRARAILLWRQGAEDLKAAKVPKASGQWMESHLFCGPTSWRKECECPAGGQRSGLRSHSLTALLRELGLMELATWGTESRALDKLDVPTRCIDALGDAAPMDVFGPEDAQAALSAASDRWQCGAGGAFRLRASAG
jgi:hypothetical protein